MKLLCASILCLAVDADQCCYDTKPSAFMGDCDTCCGLSHAVGGNTNRLKACMHACYKGGPGGPGDGYGVGKGKVVSCWNSGEEELSAVEKSKEEVMISPILPGAVGSGVKGCENAKGSHCKGNKALADSEFATEQFTAITPGLTNRAIVTQLSEGDIETYNLRHCANIMEDLGYNSYYGQEKTSLCMRLGLSCKVFQRYFTAIEYVNGIDVKFDFADTITVELISEGYPVEDFVHAIKLLDSLNFRSDRKDLGAFPLALWLAKNCVSADVFGRRFSACGGDFGDCISSTKSSFPSSSMCHMTAARMNCKYDHMECPTTTTTTPGTATTTPTAHGFPIMTCILGLVAGIAVIGLGVAALRRRSAPPSEGQYNEIAA